MPLFKNIIMKRQCENLGASFDNGGRSCQNRGLPI
jgi:hypothetical protein